MADIIGEKLIQWSQGQEGQAARISIFYGVRDIPYAVIPELNDIERYVEILSYGKGSCMPKHFLLGNMYQRLGMLILYAVYPFRWDEAIIDYPPGLKSLARGLPMSYHLACRVDIDGKLILVDATLDPALEKIGLLVNNEWDGISNTILPIIPCGEEEIYHPSELLFEQTQYNDNQIAFYTELNRWLDEVRRR